MPIDRTALTLSDASTEPSVAWANEYENKINDVTANAVDSTDGLINASSIEIDADATVAGDRSIIARLTSTTTRILEWLDASGWWRLTDEGGTTLYPLEVADATEATHAATQGQLDAVQTTLQSNIDNLVIDETGDITFSSRSSKSGWVLMAGKTIGSASSGATERANADCENLFLHLWNTYADAEAPVTGGRGASAAADWSADKKIAVPDARGRNLIGLDNMGGTSANRVTSASTNGTKASVMGGAGGAETHTLTTPQTPSHYHGFTAVVTGAPGGNIPTTGSAYGQSNSQTTNSTGGGGAHNNMPPFIAFNVFMKL